MFDSGLHLTIIDGGFSDDVATRLEQLDYESDTHNGVTWHNAWSEFSSLGRVMLMNTLPTQLSADGDEGRRAFLEKQAPDFTGSIRQKGKV